MSSPRILFLDIETFPNIGFCWGKWQTDVIEFTKERCLATVAYKWQGSPVKCLSLPSYRGYCPGSYDDRKLCRDVWRLLDAADIVVAHNGDNFDIRVMNARFIINNMPPPAPYKTVDTKKAAKKVGMFNSNKLDDLGRILVNSRKLKTDFSLWLGCIEGDRASWRKMERYNRQDVILLEKVYMRLRPWISNHPNLGTYRGDAICPKCGSGEIQWRGHAFTQTRKHRRFVCKKCGGWGRLAGSVLTNV